MKHWFNEDKSIRLYNGDYLSVVGGLNSHDVKVKMVLTDPPYLHEKGGRGKMLLGDSLDRGKFNMKDLGDFGREKIFEFLDKTKPLMEKPQWYIFCSEKQLPYYFEWVVKNKMKHNLLVWNKPLSVMNRERYSTNVEYILRIYVNGCALNKLDLDKDKDKTSHYSKHKSYTQIRGKEKLHPSQKPVELLSELIELSSCEGEVIFDPFAGASSTGVACSKLGRGFVGVELTEKYFDISVERLKQESRNG